MKAEGRKIVALTAYDYLLARLLDECEIDVLLVGDSVGTVIQGHETTLPVTLEEMIYHVRLVSRARPRALVVADMPFLSYQVGISEALRNAGRLLKEGGAEAVKVEGGMNIAPIVRALVRVDIPVMGHVGLTPQSVHRMGGYRVQGREPGRRPGQRDRILEDARAIEEAGAFALVLEGIPSDLAREITERARIPTIGIGAGPHCDGQILVTHDLLGLTGDAAPKFVKRYADLRSVICDAVRAYSADVRAGVFPSEEYAYGSSPLQERAREGSQTT